MAFLVTIVSSKGVPSQLDPTAMTKQKLLRNGLDLGDDPDVIIDGTLYRPDLADWDSPSAAYHYLRAPYNGIALPFGGKLPSKVAPTAQPSVYHRVILASVIGLASAYEETDERIFGTDETSVEIKTEQRLAIEAMLSQQTVRFRWNSLMSQRPYGR